ncbi:MULTISPECIES: sigma-54-dependent transcriptional regulator [Sphingobium]|uniref:sigma-54-dependent transcriptional regulator n=1 Tax=Sphingobium TaxID=165695 RepID=UPI0015EB70EB|nr:MULTISPECIES: sigma-54 dependent transcriptional regulator [Sphingobium]MCW2364095.1 DNA-binding NtrC family response regulator [Sphingobium sp. B10D3B]MCW2402508.1 DNA-binding NtrC family response regulator [Sphingobium sp. B10D7B]MCW2409487.1 DNA-binding NtrC family response regulator [Sphingobium xanthum]
MTDPENPVLLLVDDEPAQRRLNIAMAHRAGWRAMSASTAEDALEVLDSREGARINAVMIDDWTQEGEASDLIRAIGVRRPQLPVLVITANGSAERAVDAMRAGAHDFLIKPIAPDSFLSALQAALNHAGSAGELRPLTEKNRTPLGFDEIVGSSPTFRSALAIAAKAARARVPILIEGESGVGKEVIAHAIHAASPRARAPMVTVNCGAIPSNLVESDLFGHERGAFTGAFDRHVGKFSTANGGTIFLDEISELPLDAQVKLLRVLQDGEIQPVGARLPSQVDVRVIAATNKRLLDEVEAGRFREDLYYRLNVVQLTIPPLRDRRGDIPALARHLLERVVAQPGMRSLGITNEAINLLALHDWPGNVRQLHNTLFRAAVLCEGDALTAADFPQLSGKLNQSEPVRRENGQVTPMVRNAQESGIGITLYEPNGHLRALADIEADVIRLAIGHYRGRMTEVARRLGIGRSTLYRKLAELGIDTAA